MRRKRTVMIRAYPEDRNKLKNLTREISHVEKRDVRTPEIIRRTLNIPKLPDVLRQDADFKRRFRK